MVWDSSNKEMVLLKQLQHAPPGGNTMLHVPKRRSLRRT